MVVARDGRDGDRLAGRDLRRVLGHAPGGAARLPAAPDDPPHLASDEVGQVYVPAVNWALFVAVVALVLGFGSSQSAGRRLRHRRHRHAGDRHDPVLRRRARAAGTSRCWLVVAGAAAVPDRRPRVLRREPDEGRCTAAGSRSRSRAVVFTVLTTWQRGREIVTAQPRRGGGPAARLRRASCTRWTRRSTASPGTAVFLNAGKETTPLALRANVEHNHVAARERRDRLDRDAEGPVRAAGRAARDRRPRLPRRRHHARHRAASASRTTPDVPGAAAPRRRSGPRVRHRPRRRAPTSSRRSRSSPTDAPGMARWRKRLFVAMARNAAEPGRVLRPARRAHRHDGPAHRVLDVRAGWPFRRWPCSSG